MKKSSPNGDFSLLNKAFHFARSAHKDQLRLSGDPYFLHVLEVAKILAEMEMDIVTVTAGLLHDVVEDTGVTLQEVEEEFSAEIAQLVDGVTKISELKYSSLEEKQAENFRKMIFSMVKDIRVIMIKFADRLHNMRTLEHMPKVKQDRIALETREIHAPLAHRLGIARIKWELEDLAFRVLDSEAYEEISKKIKEKREEREKYIQRMARPIKRELKKASIKADIMGRPKHLHSIHKKMLKRNLPFEELYDLFALRLLVERVDECYFALGIVHTLYTPIHERFKDYIATPRSNMYQSIHTTVIGPEGKMVEIQIRTNEMHKTAESGIAAHWRYKEGKAKEDEFDKHLMWLRQVLDWQRDLGDPTEFMEDLKVSLFQEEIFVFSPAGDLFKLPRGSTPVDFAFAVHTDVGLHCIGAKVNGRIVALGSSIKSGDSIEILTSAKQSPNPDWYKTVKTSKARTRIKRWIKDSLLEESIGLGQELLERDLKKLNREVDEEELTDVAQSMGFQDLKHLYASLGRGESSVQGVLSKLTPDKSQPEKEDSFLKRLITGVQKSSDGIRVQGLDNLLISIAKCCQPVPGDKILGFITQGRGIVVHRVDCANLLAMLEDPERKVEVEWDVERDRQFYVRLQLVGEDRTRFLRDVSEAIASSDTNVVRMDMKSEDSLVSGSFLVEVRNLQHLTKVINKIDKVKGVLRIERLVDIDGKEDSEQKLLAL
ncbi:MAG: bifunctional (p)ppGpp synthetase/guanosine-3',5'-bis(diphosphate) 3'-pyrophosphohydrolase [bacterium]